MTKKAEYISTKTKPGLSAVLITLNNYKKIEKTVKYLYDQTVRDKIEIVIVVPKVEDLCPDTATLSSFHSYKFLELEIIDTGKAMAEGFLNCSSDIVAYCEEHSFPEPLWAETLINRHKEDWSAVGWAIANYNPDSIVSWASCYMDFGRCLHPVKSEERYRLSSHHISYKKNVLQKFKENLSELLENEAIIINEFKKNGYRTYLESSIRSHHVCISKMSSFLISEYHGGRQFAAIKSKYGQWGLIRKFIYLGGAPLRPLSKLYRILKDTHRTHNWKIFIPQILPVLIPALISTSVGEVVGYIFGVGQSSAKRTDVELNRANHI